MGLLAIQKLGTNRECPRLWIESKKLNSLGFMPGTPLTIEATSEQILLKPAILGNNHVSSRATSDGRRPIIDLENESLLSGLAQYSEVKIIASFERIQVTPSHRAFAIQRARRCQPPFRILEVFAGGGTMTAAAHGEPRYVVTAGVEINPSFADEWQSSNPAATIIQADFRCLHDSELPEFDILVGGIPCTCHSNLGRAKKGLAQRPEAGEEGDLFLPVIGLVAQRMPAAVLLENVPAFGSSLAGELVTSSLKKLGYNIYSTILQPNTEWAEIENRKRWLLVGTLDREFRLSPPMNECSVPLSSFLDPADPENDAADSRRIQQTIESLKAHNARHRAMGHGFAYSVMDGTEFSLPTIPKSYHKINTGPFLKTPYGLRMLRQAEIERIHGVTLGTRHYATAIQILGQGVQTRLFRHVFQQLADHLTSTSRAPMNEAE